MAMNRIPKDVIVSRLLASISTVPESMEGYSYYLFINSVAMRRDSASVAIYVSYDGFLSKVARCIVSAMISPICRKPHLSSKKPRFTISLAAFTIQGMFPPLLIASKARARQRNLFRSGSKKSRCCALKRSRRSPLKCRR